MHYLVHSVSPPLSTFVAYLWSLKHTAEHARERIVPSGTQELVINLHEDELCIYDMRFARGVRRFSGALVSGAYRAAFGVDTRAHACIVGVHFKPGGAGPFLGLPPGALADDHVDLETLWGAHARDLRERLCTARTSERRFAILEQALLARLRAPFRQHAAVRVALEQFARGANDIGEVAKELGLSRRRFIEVFTAEVGVAPKRFARIQRFQHAKLQAERLPAATWPAIAQDSGYFDQSHMIREFVALSGVTPAELLGARRFPQKRITSPISSARRVKFVQYARNVRRYSCG